MAGAHVVDGALVVAGAQPQATSFDAGVAGLIPQSRKANPIMDTIVPINNTRRFMVTLASRSSSEVRRNQHNEEKYPGTAPLEALLDVL